MRVLAQTIVVFVSLKSGQDFLSYNFIKIHLFLKFLVPLLDYGLCPITGDMEHFLPFYLVTIENIYKNQLHAVSRTQQGKQRDPSVKILRYHVPTFCRILEALCV